MVNVHGSHARKAPLFAALILAISFASAPPVRAAFTCDVWYSIPWTDGVTMWGRANNQCVQSHGDPKAKRTEGRLYENAGPFTWERDVAAVLAGGTWGNLSVTNDYYCNGHGTDDWWGRAHGTDVNNETSGWVQSATVSRTC